MSNEQQGPAAGFYKGRAIAGSAQYGEKNGNEQICLDLEVPSLHRQFTTFLYFSEAAEPYAIQRLRACGWTGDDISNLVGIDKNEIDVQIKYEEYNGKVQMKVDIATGGGTFKMDQQMDDRAKRAFAARLKSRLKGGATPTPPPRAQQSQARQPPPTTQGGFGSSQSQDDDIPF